MSVIVLIPAAGFGRRMGSDISKQYLELSGRPILAHTLRLFDEQPQVDRIYLIASPQATDFCREELLERYRYFKVAGVIAGGAERQDSVRHGLLACEGGDDDLVLIHDGVRPLFSPRFLAPLLELVNKEGAAIVAVPVKDTIKEVEGGRVVATPVRERLWQAQTPQGFRFPLIRDAHLAAERDRYIGTDDASLVERLGCPVAVLPGDGRNLKITTPEDLILAEALLAGKNGEEQ